jgi:hypothetical protein
LPSKRKFNSITFADTLLKKIFEFAAGMLVCWLLNVVQLGIAFVLLAGSEKALPSVYVLTLALWLVQFGYVIPIYRVLRRKQRPYAAYGLLTAACITAIITVILDYKIFGAAAFKFWS